MRWKPLFPRHQLFRQNDLVRFFIVPVKVYGAVAVRPRRFVMFKDIIGIEADGWLIRDLEGEIVSFNTGRTQAKIHFQGSLPVVARNWKEAQRSVHETTFKAVGGVLDGPLTDVTIEIGRVIHGCRPGSEDDTWMTLVVH